MTMLNLHTFQLDPRLALSVRVSQAHGVCAGCLKVWCPRGVEKGTSRLDAMLPDTEAW